MRHARSSLRIPDMRGAKVRWHMAEERFEVVDHGVLWFDDDSSIIGATSG